MTSVYAWILTTDRPTTDSHFGKFEIAVTLQLYSLSTLPSDTSLYITGDAYFGWLESYFADIFSVSSPSGAGSNRPSSQLTLWTRIARLPQDTPAYKAGGATSICHSVAFQVRVGGDVRTTLEAGDLINSAGTTVHLLLTSGDELSAVIRQHSEVTLRSFRTTR